MLTNNDHCSCCEDFLKTSSGSFVDFWNSENERTQRARGIKENRQRLVIAERKRRESEEECRNIPQSFRNAEKPGRLVASRSVVQSPRRAPANKCLPVLCVYSEFRLWICFQWAINHLRGGNKIIIGEFKLCSVGEGVLNPPVFLFFLLRQHWQTYCDLWVYKRRHRMCVIIHVASIKSKHARQRRADLLLHMLKYCNFLDCRSKEGKSNFPKHRSSCRYHRKNKTTACSESVEI